MTPPGHRADLARLGRTVHVDYLTLLTDTGTSAHEPGPALRSERSATAGNTVEIGGADSAEAPDAFRAARARVSCLTAGVRSADITGAAVHDVSRSSRGRPHHRRRWSLAADGLRIDDLVTGRGRHEIVVRWHLSAGAIAEVTDRTAVVTSAAGSFLMTVKATTAVMLGVETRPVTTGSAGTADALVLTCRMNADLPARVTSCWSRARGDAAQEMT